MDQIEKRKLENQLLAMGMPKLEDPALIQVIADMVNGYRGDRVEMFCGLLNECVGEHRREMYEALRPKMHFPVPSLDACEAAIALRAERLIRPEGLGARPKSAEALEVEVEIPCGRCKMTAKFTGRTLADAMGSARRAGWGRGADRRLEYCPQCRLETMPVKVHGRRLARMAAGQA